jgi:glycosyltransferase involved in cell wall biosynthesis
MTISVIICTYNRCESLKRTLQTCCDLVIPADVTWQLVVADNNSTDDTRQVCDKFKEKLPLHYLLEPRQGKSCALNRALRETKADIHLLTDDDVDVDPMWLSSMWKTAQLYPQASFFGGRVFPRWDALPPRWIRDNCHPFLDYVFVRYDPGAAERFVDHSTHPFLGANLALRRQVFANGFRFNESIGPQGNNQIHGEETELQRNLLKQGHQGIYVPDAVVHHRNSRKRMTETYLRRYFKGMGMREVRLGGCHQKTHLWFGAPRGLWKVWAEQLIKYLFKRCLAGPRVWVEAEIKMSITWGNICEWRHQRSLQTSGR